MRFWRAGWPDKVAASIKAQAAMMRLAQRETDALVATAGLAHLVRSDGVLELYESDGEIRAAQHELAAKTREGIEHRLVRGDALLELQPGLAPSIVAATFIPKWQTVTDPYEYTMAIGAAAMARGAVFRKAEAKTLRPRGDGVTIELSDGTSLAANKVVVAGGAWSRALTAPLGDLIPLETERGYNTTLPRDSFDLRRQLVFGGPWLCRDAAVDRRAHRRGGGIGRAEAAAEFRAGRRDADQGCPADAGPQGQRRHAMDGFSPVAARQPAGDRPLTPVAAHHLCFRAWPSRPHPIGRVPASWSPN